MTEFSVFGLFGFGVSLFGVGFRSSVYLPTPSRAAPGGISRESGSRIGQAFKEEGKQRYGRAILEEEWACNYALFSSRVQL